MSETRLTKGIYKADVSGNLGMGRPRKTYMDLIGSSERTGAKYPKQACVYD